MFNKSLPLLVIGLWGIVVLPLPDRVSAATPLTRAEIQSIRNLVQLIPKNKLKKRPAQKSDAMIPGDGLSTGQASLADLRFNDGSLARVGEQAIFQFLPKTRSFRLSNGTALLLIPPGRGQTRIQTPSAAAAIRGSALFVRYDQQTDTTVVGALTNSGIEVSNKEASQTQVLQAGQLMVIVKGKFQGLYDFDLRNFYETSDLVLGLDLNRQNMTPNPDPAIASVQAETAAALQAQSPITGEGVVENPSFLQLTASPTNSTANDIVTNDSALDPIQDDSPVNSFEETGQILSNTEQATTTSNNSNTKVQTNNVPIDSSGTTTIPQTPVVNTGNENPVVNTGNDNSAGGMGNDNSAGGMGNDNSAGGMGNDNSAGGAGNDNSAGGMGNDNSAGGAGNDNSAGGAGNDNSAGGAGNDNSAGGAGNDNSAGGAGNDNSAGGAGNDNSAGGAGNDNSGGDTVPDPNPPETT
ncbi:FecR domain-containing protein [Nostoc calcicola FACHB-3891]|nr:FecR domain-containing protein [Nostoc calcicola FACHB-3891]